MQNITPTDYTHPELTEFRLKIALLIKRGVEPMAAKRIVATDRIAKSERKSQGLAVYSESPAEPDADTKALRQQWDELRRSIKAVDESLSSLLVSSGVVAVRGDTVVIGTHIDKIAERLQYGSRREMIEQALCSVLQHSFQVEFVWAERSFWYEERKDE
jgi:hypothetical protein